jgi:methionine synthase I (cobalamin-dependent)
VGDSIRHPNCENLGIACPISMGKAFMSRMNGMNKPVVVCFPPSVLPLQFVVVIVIAMMKKKVDKQQLAMLNACTQVLGGCCWVGNSCPCQALG